MDSQSSKSLTLSMPLAVVIAGLAIGGAVLWSNLHPSEPGQATNPTQPSAQQTADISRVKTTGEPFVGNPNAPVTIAYWFDYQCPFCKQHEETVMPQLMTDYVDAGKVKIVFKDFQFLGEDSQRLGQFARAVWALAPDKFYAWHKAVYDNQGTENTGWATQAAILAITRPVLGPDLTAKALQLMQSNGVAYQKEMDADKAEGNGFGVNATPSFVIGKQLVVGAVPYSQIQAAIDAAGK